MSIAVVIVNYNSGALLQRCLLALSRQTRPADHVIVVDNDSSDSETLRILDELSNVELIRNPSNPGYGAAINTAVAQLDHCEYLCCLNPDAFPRPNWLEILVASADQHPAYGSFASLMLKADDEAIVDGAGDLLHISGVPRRRYHGRLLGSVRITTEPVFSACGGAAMYRLSAFVEVGGFDESYFMYVEDIDLGYRLQLCGHPCLLVSNAIVEHIGSAITGERSDFTVYHGHRNLVFNYVKNTPLPLLVGTLPIHIVANIWSIIVLTLKGHGKPIVRAKKDALKSLFHYVRKRQPDHSFATSLHIWRMLDKRGKS
jgi:GT2 family glycosyltransferase